jgi:hypothetical protein
LAWISAAPSRCDRDGRVRPARGRGSLAPCWISIVLALEIQTARRETLKRNLLLVDYQRIFIARADVARHTELLDSERLLDHFDELRRWNDNRPIGSIPNEGIFDWCIRVIGIQL